jgi:hypothetical protein
MDTFSNFFPSLQSLVDLEISNLALEFSCFSLDQCDVYLKLVLQSIIVIINNCKDSPKKLETVTALLIATRADEVVNLLGKIGKLDELVGINIRITKGGSYFNELMKGGLKESKNKTKRGGKGCKRSCSEDSMCTDANCPSCVDGKCAAAAVPSSGTSAVVLGPIGQPPGTPLYLQQYTASQYAAVQSDVSVVAKLLTSAAIESAATTNQAVIATLNSVDTRLTQANSQVVATQEAMNALLREHTNSVKTEFESIYEKQKLQLTTQERTEAVPAAVGAVLGGTVSYKLAKGLMTSVNAITGKGMSFLYWLLLSGGVAVNKIADKIPFTNKSEALFDTQCQEGGPIGKIWATVVPTAQTAITYSYKYKNIWTGSETDLSHQPECMVDNSWYEKIGKCAESTTATTITECQKMPNFFDLTDLFGNNIEIGSAILGFILSAIMVFYFIRIITLQTKLLEFKTTKAKSLFSGITGILSDTMKVGATLTGVGAAIQIILPSEERSELVELVRSNQIRYEGNLVTMVEYGKAQGELYKSDPAYAQLVEQKQQQQAQVTSLQQEASSLTRTNIEMAANVSKQTANLVAQIAFGAFGALGSTQSQLQIDNSGKPSLVLPSSSGPPGPPGPPSLGGKKTKKYKRKQTRKRTKKRTRNHKKYTKKRKTRMRR